MWRGVVALLAVTLGVVLLASGCSTTAASDPFTGRERLERGSFQLTGIPCIEIAARFSSAQGDLARLQELRAWTESLVDLAPWLSVIDERIERAKFQPRILAIVRDNPGAHQNALAKVLGADGRMVGRLVTDMENLGLLSRIPDGKTNALYLPNDVPTQKLAEKTPRPSREPRQRPVPSVVRPRRIVVQDPTDTWIAIDFETATSSPNSVCALGVAVLQHGEIASTGAWLIKPPGNVYDRQNIAVHGIGPRATKRAQTYAELYPSLMPFLEDRFLLAHWASFDVSVLRAVHAYYGIPLPTAHYACSCRMAQRAYPRLGNHRLPTVCEHCGIELRHHDAASDAMACARIALTCRDVAGAASIHEAVEALGVQLRGL